MKNNFFLLSIAIGLSVSSNAEVEISVGGYANDEIHISANGNNIQTSSVSTDKNGNTNYIYVDKGSQIIDSTIGSTVISNHKFTKEEGIQHYTNKINRYEEKIAKYHDKINHYQQKIADKPRKRERYQNKIVDYQDKINNYKEKILEAERKLEEYQSIKK